MKHDIISATCLVTLLLAGCSGTSPSAGGDAVDPTDPCGAKGYSSLLGAPLAAVTLPADLNDRVIQPGTAATTDFDPSRLNLELDANGTIIGLSCG